VTILGFIVFTGPVLLFILDSNLGQVISSLYGKTLLIKLALALAMLAIGSYNQLSIQRDARSRVAISMFVTANGKSSYMDDPPNQESPSDSSKKNKNKNEDADIISRFSRSTKAESVVGILLLASVAFLVNTGVPASQGQNQIGDQQYSNMALQQFQEGFRGTYFGD